MLTSILGIAAKLRKSPAAAQTSPGNGNVGGTSSALQACICASPLLAPCGLTPATVAANLSRWETLGNRVASNLGMPTSFEALTDVQRERIYQYYLPVYFWVLSQLETHRKSASTEPLVVGISAPQGCGKSTLCEQLEALLISDNLTPASLSIDDFYLTRAEQEALAKAHPGNPLLFSRGNAGSHDVALGDDTLRKLRSATAKSPPVPLPRYNKSAFQGQGDRAELSTWPAVQGPVDVVLLEGWMLGFNPVEPSKASSVDAHLTPVNASLTRYESAWDCHVSAWLVVKVSDPQFAYKWRLQAEHAMRAAGKDAMTDQQVAAFVDRFMPSYKCYLPGLYSNGPTTAQPGKLLVVEVDEKRSPAAQQPTPIM